MEHVLTPHFLSCDAGKRSTSVIPATMTWLSLNSSLCSPTTTVQGLCVYRKTTSRLPPLVTSQGEVIYQKGAVLHRYEKKALDETCLCCLTPVTSAQSRVQRKLSYSLLTPVNLCSVPGTAQIVLLASYHHNIRQHRIIVPLYNSS